MCRMRALRHGCLPFHFVRGGAYSCSSVVDGGVSDPLVAAHDHQDGCQRVVDERGFESGERSTCKGDDLLLEFVGVRLSGLGVQLVCAYVCAPSFTLECMLSSIP